MPSGRRLLILAVKIKALLSFRRRGFFNVPFRYNIILGCLKDALFNFRGVKVK